MVIKYSHKKCHLPCQQDWYEKNIKSMDRCCGRLFCFSWWILLSWMHLRLLWWGQKKQGLKALNDCSNIHYFGPYNFVFRKKNYTEFFFYRHPFSNNSVHFSHLRHCPKDNVVIRKNIHVCTSSSQHSLSSWIKIAHVSPLTINVWKPSNKNNLGIICCLFLWICKSKCLSRRVSPPPARRAWSTVMPFQSQEASTVTS